LINRRFDIISGGVFLVIGAFFVTASRGISKSSYGSNVGPAVFPTLLGGFLILLSLMVIATAMKTKQTAAKEGAKGYGRLALLILAMLVYIALFEPLGYVISTFVFLVFLFQLVERKNLVRSILISAGFSAFVYIGYVVLLQGNLPAFPEFLSTLLGRG
jgi:putative tricarboxylic transport membrane protein